MKHGIMTIALAALIAGAGPASAQGSSYQITWHHCFDRNAGPDTDVYGAMDFVVLATGEKFHVQMRLIHDKGGSSLSFEYFAMPSGARVTTIHVSGAQAGVQTTSYGQSVSQDAAIAFADILREPDFQTTLQSCVALCQPETQKLYTPLCLLARSLCCSISTGGCAACDGAGSTCHETFHASCP